MATLYQTDSAIDSIKSLLNKISSSTALRIMHVCQYSNGKDCVFYKINFEEDDGLKVGYIFYNANNCLVYRARYKKMGIALPADIFDLLLDIYNHEIYMIKAKHRSRDEYNNLR